MNTLTVVGINPALVVKGAPQKVAADLKKFIKAGAVVAATVAALEPFKIITCVDQQNDAMDVMKQAAKVSKAIEARRVELVKPWNTEVDKINAFAKGLCKQIDTLVDAGKKAVLAFSQAEERKAKEAKKTARIEVLLAMGFELNAAGCYQREGIGYMNDTELENYLDSTFLDVTEAWAFKIKKQAEVVIAEAEKEEESDLSSIFGNPDDMVVTNSKVEAAKKDVALAAPVYSAGSYSTAALKGKTARWTYEVTDINQVPREFLVIDSAAVRKAINEGLRTIAGINIFEDQGLSLR